MTLRTNGPITPRFEGLHTVITGGTSGIGLATGFRLGAEGACLTILGRSDRQGQQAVAQLQQAGYAATFVTLDLADHDSISDAAAATVRSGPVDVLINNAGVVHINGRQNNPFATSGLSGWDDLVDVNLRGCADFVHCLLPDLRDGGSIVNVSSEGAVKARDTRWIYDLTKAGLLSFSRSLAAALAPRGIRVNSIAPGGTVTEMHTGDAADPDAERARLLALPAPVLLGRLARPEEIAAAIAFLASSDASYITGTTLFVDGGGSGMR